MVILLYILLAGVLGILAILIVGCMVTLLASRSPYHAMFIKAKAPNPAPNGFYPGMPHVLLDKSTPWLGKSFDPKAQTGFNIFTPMGAKILKIATPLYRKFDQNQEGNTKAYYFRTYVGKGKKDTSTDVMKLDYSSSENPWLIRIILDEIVEIEPDRYLGKIHVKVLPWFYVTIGYFSLQA